MVCDDTSEQLASDGLLGAVLARRADTFIRLAGGAVAGGAAAAVRACRSRLFWERRLRPGRGECATCRSGSMVPLRCPVVLLQQRGLLGGEWQ